MPSQEEWNNVREEFERLYVTQGRTLSDVSSRLVEKGFHATTKQYKNQITLWKLHKYSRHSDMVFAKRKLSECSANEEETSFVIHGQVKTSKDISRYWKRARKAPPRNTDPDPSTPPGIEYFNSRPTRPANVSKPRVPKVPETKDDNNTGITMVRVPVPNLAPVTMTGRLRDFEIAIWHAQDYFRFCSSPHDNRLARTINPPVPQSRCAAVYIFLGSAMALTHRARFGDIPSSALMAMQECEKLLPTILAGRDSKFLLFLLRILSNYCQEGLSVYIRSFLYMITQHITKDDALMHPILPLVLALARSPHHIPQMAETILQSRVTQLTEQLGPDDLQTTIATHSLASVYAVNRKWSQSYDLTMTAYNRFIKVPQHQMSERMRICLFSFHAELAHAEFELGRFTDAIRRVEDAIRLSQQVQSNEQMRAASQCSLLVLMGDAQAARGMPEARLSYERALQTAKGVLPLDHPQYLQAAIGLRKIMKVRSRAGQASGIDQQM